MSELEENIPPRILSLFREMRKPNILENERAEWWSVLVLAEAFRQSFHDTSVTRVARVLQHLFTPLSLKQNALHARYVTREWHSNLLNFWMGLIEGYNVSPEEMKHFVKGLKRGAPLTWGQLTTDSANKKSPLAQDGLCLDHFYKCRANLSESVLEIIREMKEWESKTPYTAEDVDKICVDRDCSAYTIVVQSTEITRVEQFPKNRNFLLALVLLSYIVPENGEPTIQPSRRLDPSANMQVIIEGPFCPAMHKTP